jgi:hypothetical protein
MASPNQYHLAGRGIVLSYFPGGNGPDVDGKGRLKLSYQDSHQQLAFRGDAVATHVVDGLGTLVTVTLTPPPAKGVTTFTFVLPTVELDGGVGASVSLCVEAITTITRHPLSANAQQQTYAAARLAGDALIGKIAD